MMRSRVMPIGRIKLMRRGEYLDFDTLRSMADNSDLDVPEMQFDAKTQGTTSPLPVNQDRWLFHPTPDGRLGVTSPI